VDDDRGDADFVGGGNLLNECGVGLVRKAFVVNDDIESLVPVRIVVQRQLAVGDAGIRHDDRPVDRQRLRDGIDQILFCAE
jgi:hypothetical protein